MKVKALPFSVNQRRTRNGVDPAKSGFVLVVNDDLSDSLNVWMTCAPDPSDETIALISIWVGDHRDIENARQIGRVAFSPLPKGDEQASADPP